MQQRATIIEGVFKLAVKFKQSRDTVHIAIDLIDRLYLEKS